MIPTKKAFFFNFWSWVLAPLRPLLAWLAARRDALHGYYGLQDVVDFWIGAQPEFDPSVYPTDARMQEQRKRPPEYEQLQAKLESVESRIAALPPYLPWLILLFVMFGMDFGSSAGFLYNQGLTGWMLWLSTPTVTVVLFALATSAIREQRRKKERDVWLIAVRVLFVVIAVAIGWLQYQETTAADEQDVAGALASGLIWSALVVGPAIVAHLLSSKLALVRPLILERRRIRRRLASIDGRVAEAESYLDHLDRARRIWEDEFRAIRGPYNRHFSHTYLKNGGDPETLQYFLTTQERLRVSNDRPIDEPPRSAHLTVVNPYERRE